LVANQLKVNQYNEGMRITLMGEGAVNAKLLGELSCQHHLYPQYILQIKRKALMLHFNISSLIFQQRRQITSAIME